MITVWFDDILKTKTGKNKPYWSATEVKDAVDQEEVYFHEGYGRLRKYRLHKVDEINYIAEKV